MRLTIYDHALTDPRFMRLGMRLGITRHAARGHCEPVWMRCYSLRTNLMDAQDVDALAEISGFGAAMVDASLARVVEGEKLQLWICGVASGMQWLIEQDRKRDLALAAKRSRMTSRGESPGKSPGDVPRDVPAQEQEQEQDQGQDLIGSKAKRDAAELAELAVAEINRLSGSRYQADSAETVKNASTLAKRGVTPEDIRRVLAAKWGEWSKSDQMRAQFKPSVLLRPSNFIRYREDLDARAPSKAAQGRLAVPTSDHIVLDDDTIIERRAS
jgi:hypothetical protein